jgi:acyl transferase domain-containing protein/aryl carrier-like protein/dienelactone hydrolase
MAANRLSYLFNLRGPSLAIDTACSSSLVAVHLACQSLRSGESTMAIAGGVNLILRPELTIGFSKLTALSPENRCKAFDAAANGFVRSEGAGAVVLKPLSQAIAQGDSVYAVIRGSAVNQDGRTNGLTAPNREAQEQVIQSAFAQAGLTPEQVDYIEAHGTGTLLGDPIEAKALGNALQDRPAEAPPVRMGSVKSNIGHTEAAAGIASLIKTALCLKHRTLVPSLHFQTPNPHIPFADLPLRVQQTCESWPTDRPADRPLAGVSAFAFGGTNAHVVLQAAPDLAPLLPDWERPRHVLALSAKTPAALTGQTQQLLDALAQGPELADLCYSINARRADFPYRRAIAATTLADLQTGLDAPYSPPAIPPKRPQVVFLFTGQGSQYGGMGQELYNTQPVFRDVLDYCAEAVSPYLDVPLLEVMFAAADDHRLQQTAYTQPALFALEYALAMLWQDWGIQPAAVLGHSVGEYVAACVAGVLSLEDGLRLIAQRGKLMQSLPAGGVMAAVWANEAMVERALAKVGADQREDGQAEIATVNGPHNTVIAGQKAAIAEVIDHLHTQGTRTQYLEVSHAFHSPQMEPILPLFEHMAQQVTYQPARIPMGLNVTGQVLAVGDTLEPQYWCRHARQAVRFADGLQALHHQGLTCFLELGPHPILCGLGRRVLTAPNLTWLPTLRRGQDDWTGLLASLGTLYEQGFTVDWQGFDRPYGRTVLQGLPSYPFQRQRYWFEPPATLTAGPTLPAASASAATPEFYHLTWQTLPTLPPLPIEVGGRWLIFMDEQGFGEALTQVLQAHQGSVVAVHPDKTFTEAGSKASSEPFRLNPFEPAASQALFAQLNATLGPPWRGVIYLWGLNGSSGIENAEASTAGLLHCLQGLVTQPLDGAQLWVVSQGVQATDQVTQARSPGAGTLWGLGAAIALEHPELWGGLVDIVPTNPPTPVLAKQLLAHCLATDGEDRVVVSADLSAELSAEKRWGARLTPISDPAAPDQSLTIQPDKTYLITGGLGALGLATAQWLVDAGATSLVLISRRGETPHHQAPLRALRQSGAKVWVEAVDVADPEAVHHLIQKIQTVPLAGIIHGAGTLDDGLLVGQSWAQFQTVMAPKVQGAWNLHQATTDLQLDFFVLFSSVASLLGSPGQGNYAAANGFLDSLAQYRRQQGLPAQSINWGPWQGSGLATQHQATVQRLKKQGIDSFTPAQGIQHLETLLTQGSAYPPQVAAVQVQWPVLVQKLPQVPPWLQQVAPTQVAQPVAFWEQLVPLAPMARVTPLQSYLHQEISAILGRTETIPVGRNLLDVGLDSLMVMDLLGLCKRDLGLTLYPREVFEHPTLAALSRYMAQELARIHPELGHGPANSVSPDGTVGGDHWRIPIWGQARTFAPPSQKLPGPVFLLSSPRSGSTLLRVMLAGHPDLFCPPELHLLPFETLAERQDALAENYLGEGLQRALMDLAGLEGSASQQLLAKWIDQGMDIPTVYDKLQELTGDRRLVDKSPTYGFSPSTLNRAEQIFDRAKYIHLVRHPYAVIDSFVSNRMDKLFKIPDQEPYGLAERVWHSSNQNILSFLTGIEGDRHHTLCYEDLVRDPEQAMVALCKFLDLPFHQALVDPYGSAAQRMTDGVTAQSLPIDDPNFHRRKTIEPALADTWKTVKLPRPLNAESQTLAQTWHYDLPFDAAQGRPPSDSPPKPYGQAPPTPHHPVTWIQTDPLATLSEQTVTVRGLDLCLCTWGAVDRPAILCLHGVLEQGAIWDAIAPTLVAQGYRVIAPDLRGHGRSAHLGPEGNYQLLDHLADIDALTQELGLATLTVLGHSMGAMVGAALTVARPDRVKGLVLVEPVVPGDDDGTQTADQLTAHLDYLTNRPTHAVYPDRAAAIARLQKALPFLSRDRAAALAERILQPVPGGVQWAWDPRLQVRTRFGLSGGTFTRDRYGQILQGISVPTTLVFGKGSEFIRPEDQTFQSQRLPHSTVHSIPGGHQLPLESPQALVEIIGAALPDLQR